MADASLRPRRHPGEVVGDDRRQDLRDAVERIAWHATSSSSGES